MPVQGGGGGVEILWSLRTALLGKEERKEPVPSTSVTTEKSRRGVGEAPFYPSNLAVTKGEQYSSPWPVCLPLCDDRGGGEKKGGRIARTRH